MFNASHRQVIMLEVFFFAAVFIIASVFAQQIEVLYVTYGIFSSKNGQISICKLVVVSLYDFYICYVFTHIIIWSVLIKRKKVFLILSTPLSLSLSLSLDLSLFLTKIFGNNKIR